MRNFHKNQLGIGLLEILIVIAVVAMIAGGAWVVYNRNHKSTSSGATKSAETNNTSTKTASEPDPTPTSQKYLVITEWGVKLPLSDVISDAYYVVSTSSQDENGQPNTMWLGLKSLDSDPNCQASRANTGGPNPLGAFMKALPTDTNPVTGTLYTEMYPDGTTIGDYYYAYKDGGTSSKCRPDNLAAIQAAFKLVARSVVNN